MKNQEITQTYYSLMSLRQNQEIKFPSKVSYAIVRNIRELQSIVEDIESTRNNIIITYGEPVPEQPEQYKEKEGSEGRMFKEIEDLYNTETKLKLQSITMDDLNGLDLSVSDMDALYFMIGEEE